VTAGPRAPALLADVTWYGTLAAARDLGSRGVPITLACDASFAPARWSRYVSATAACPPTGNHELFLEWLHGFGDRHPGHVLYPTSDDAAWLVARNGDELACKYRLYSPPLTTLAVLLDKVRLTAAGRAAGLAIPQVWAPADETEVEQIAREARFPLFVKPRVPLLSTLRIKGTRVDRREDLVPVWRRARLPDERERQLGPLPLLQGAGRPVIVACYPASEVIFTVDGFMDRSGEMIALGCNKLLQLPRRLGAGVIFEEAPIPAAVETGLALLLRRLGYFGVYDAEFVVDGDRLMLIDVNPRFYNHMAFEIDRGLPLPWLAYLGALDDREALAAAMRAAHQDARDDGRVYVHRLPTSLMLTLQRLTGRISREEGRAWRRWMAARAARVTDPSRAAGDRWPGLVDYPYHALKLLRHPRAFLRELTHAGATR
jgi:D-aspartate ligase